MNILNIFKKKEKVKGYSQGGYTKTTEEIEQLELNRLRELLFLRDKIHKSKIINIYEGMTPIKYCSNITINVIPIT